MILLDTCTLLWLSDRAERLPPKVQDAIRLCPPEHRYVSAISAFEIAYKVESGKLELPMPATRWFAESCAQRGLRCLPITDSIAMRAAQLPRHHRDPADRFIISTAQEFGLRIATPDALFAPYDVDVLWDL